MFLLRLLFIIIIVALGYYVFTKLNSSSTKNKEDDKNKPTGGRAPLN
jgi:hypothetical protein